MSSDNEKRKELHRVLSLGGFSASEIRQFEDGKMVSGTLESTNERELAARFGCLLQDTTMETMREVFLHGKREHDPAAFQVGSMEELDQLKLEPNRDETVQLYLKQSSELNLSAEEMSSFVGLDTAEQVEECLRSCLKARYEDYLENGLDGIPYYDRKKGGYEPGEELKLKSQKAEILKLKAPQFYKCLNHYPKVKPDALKEAFSWVNFTIDDKPTICLVHKFGMEENGMYVYCQRHFYVSRGHNSVQGVGGAFRFEEDSTTALVYGSRTSTDRVAGFGGSAKRAIGSKIMTGKIAKNIEAARERMQNA